MRVSAFTLISIVASLATYVAGHSSKSAYTARELVDEFATRDLEAFDYALERREILADLSTRNLIDELSDRLERRSGTQGAVVSKVVEKVTGGYKCPYCSTVHPTKAAAKDCSTKSQYDGGCKIRV